MITLDPIKSILWKRAVASTTQHAARVRAFYPSKARDGKLRVIVRDLVLAPDESEIWSTSYDLADRASIERQAEEVVTIYRHRLTVDWYRIHLARYAKDLGMRVNLDGVYLG